MQSVDVLHPRAVRRHVAGADDFAALLAGQQVDAAMRRGKFLWLPLSSGDALVAHLGMSGQLLVENADAPDEKHLRVRLRFGDGDPELRFVDQRTFGGLSVAAGGAALPGSLAHIGLDPIDPAFDDDAFVAGLRRRRTGVKRAPARSDPDQRHRQHLRRRGAVDRPRCTGPARPRTCRDRSAAGCWPPYARCCPRPSRPAARPFDALYVNVNGQSGYFDRSLHAYGREGEPCDRCGTPIRRSKFMGRSSYWCPKDQPQPRHPHY